jgi:hypothetical protein
MTSKDHGFCFEARQKRILIGDEHYLVDLVFYYRILTSEDKIGVSPDFVEWSGY